MIPKIIHYCWFGRKEKSVLAQKCIESWRRFCPDYEIIEWNEDNFDVHQNAYTSFLYKNEKYAFLSDYARLLIVYQHGGLYFDVDVEIVRSLDSLIGQEAFFGFELKEYVNTGIGFGAEQRHVVVKKMLEEYDPFLDGKHGFQTCPRLNTAALLKLGLVQNGEKQRVAGATIYPIEVFNPYDDPTGRLRLTEDTYSIHWYAKSWLSKGTILRSKLMKPVHRILGVDFFRRKKV